MNKAKIMDQLMDIRELTGGADVPISIETLNDDLMAIRDISTDSIKELNVKPIMPKVFDEWYKDVIESYGGPNTRKTLAIAFNTLLTVDASIYDESELSLKDWFVESNSIEDLDRISKCIDAIRYGYEVEK
ncbi:hypothetical protein [Companilactobacillus nuruki]|uniref:Uncharacterized protein n=1 Tax=Companilactobacillus nuruki TaxID=1993540 RepID=A0A2N7AV31_9LACO|nr:hypothetical protein [Companilactobacillus nuruki]PMD71484.1 hypothetical protein CBP76_05070 [Companilactobacillus nuruki]